MDKPRESSSRVVAALRGIAPAPAVWGFLLLLALVFAGSYALGSAVGPIGPGTQSTSTDEGDDGRQGSTHGGEHGHQGAHP
ncbi:hypothetical protein ABZ318_33830 [Streptomyces sp. NPDC006197]|uniref:hypothetical protein n=1 Tax=Streptomyces sp. NPDC006197 TaxID=3156685 RepID=UPI0033A23CF7